jgi:hypothetical protein
MDEADNRADNPYTALEGFKVHDASGTEVGEIEATVYDAPSDVLKYVVVKGRPIPAEAIDVDAARQLVSIPYEREAVDSAPEMEIPSGTFDAAVHEHYEARS